MNSSQRQSGLMDLRMTRQRQVILEQVQNDPEHPTADEVYQAVRHVLPHISLATVYRNLELLCEHGFLRKLEMCGAQKRFDADLSFHYHVRCVDCGAIQNVPVDYAQSLEQEAQLQTEFEILQHRVEFMGRCPQCQKRTSRQDQSTEEPPLQKEQQALGEMKCEQ